MALMVASELDRDFTYAERFADSNRESLFRVAYRLPKTLGPFVHGKRVAIVNDVISAGSAVRGAFADLQRLGAHVAVIGSLLVLGDQILPFAAEHHLPIEALASEAANLWTPADCPLCRSGLPLEKPVA